MTLIQNIASQTNLLALNANHRSGARRRARPGIRGVASEVKALATRPRRRRKRFHADPDIQAATSRSRRAIQSLGDQSPKFHEISTHSNGREQQGAATRRNFRQRAAGGERHQRRQ